MPWFKYELHSTKFDEINAILSYLLEHDKCYGVSLFDQGGFDTVPHKHIFFRVPWVAVENFHFHFTSNTLILLVVDSPLIICL